MKFSWRIFFLCIGVYIVSLTITGVVVTENTYNSLLQVEIERSLEEENNLHSTLTLYLLNNKRFNHDNLHIKDYSQSMVDIFKSEKGYLEIFDEHMNLLATNSPKIWPLPREELEASLAGKRNFILRQDGDSHYLFISDELRINDEKILVGMIKDITHINSQRSAQYLFFVHVGLLGLFFVAIITSIISKFLMRPIEQLGHTAKSIASGNYHERVNIERNDEIGLLGEQFNTMAMEIDQKIRQLKTESQRQQRFIDNLTHELRTPLTSIIGYAELLKNVDYDHGLFQKSLDYIHSEGARMLNLSNKLMDVILLRRKALRLETLDVQELLTNVQGVMQVKAQEKNIQLELQGAETFKIEVDIDLFKGALINLIDNALKASPLNGKVTIGTDLASDKKIIFIQDQGRGIPPSEQEKILEPFYRVEYSRSRKEGGLGLGLTLCHQIIEGHGAKFEIHSEENLGTRIEIIF